MNTAMLYIAKRMEKMTCDDAQEFISGLGWRFLAGGCYKEVYFKKGATHVIKFLYETSTYFDRSLEAEFGDSGPYGLPSCFVGETLDGKGFGFQKAVRLVGSFWDCGYLGKHCNRYRKIQNKLIEAGHMDCHADNVGVNEFGEFVQFD